jgi:hypothetical protein
LTSHHRCASEGLSRNDERRQKGIGEALTKGADFTNVQAPLAALLVFVLAFSVLALTRFRRTLD